MHPIIVAANWKMNKTWQEGLGLAQEVSTYLSANPLPDTQVILFPSFIHLEAVHRLLSSHLALFVGAQNCHEELSGAFTGEVSARMLASIGARYVLIGHSERRQHFGERHELIAKKIDAALQCDLQPILCCGEPWTVREKGEHAAYIGQQLADSLFHLTPEQVQRVIIAYEPVWAIGTGSVPDTATIADTQAVVRRTLAQRYDSAIAQQIKVLYGGSCNANNIQDFVHIPGINGVLVGNASLEANNFLHILNALQKN